MPTKSPVAAPTLPRFGDGRRMRIGVLGGSFNPAHAGHLDIARTALRRLRLDQVWLLVSPGNPLKQAAGMQSQALRLESARALLRESGADRRQILATDIERGLNTRYTIDTIRVLRRRFPRVKFVWLMGADNLTQFPRWRDWMGIARRVPFAVLPRPTYTRGALAAQAARRLGWSRRSGRQAPVLADLAAPAWVFLVARENALSATALRRAAAGEDPSPGSPRRPPPREPKNPSAAPPSRPRP
jgi:nicotinate-nucleotide adenylyltransferase